MLIGILETGDVAEHRRGAHGGFADMFRTLLGRHGFEFRVWRVVDGELPSSPDQADGWLITGSKHAVYQDLPWIAPLEAFVRAVYAAGVPLAGICFGHQLMAQALGGKVVKSEKGWGIGPQTYDSAETGGKITVLASHEDQVVEKPADAEPIAASAFCEFAGLAYKGGPAISYQPHPEFTRAFSTQLITERRGALYDPEEADAALARMDAPLDSEWMGERMARFFRENAKAPAEQAAGA